MRHIDPEFCKKEVYLPGGWRSHQCSKKPKKDGYCMQHHPDTVKKREAESNRRYEEKRARDPYTRLQKAFERERELLAAVKDYRANQLSDTDAKSCKHSFHCVCSEDRLKSAISASETALGGIT